MSAQAYGLLSQGWKPPVLCAATAALPSNTYSNGVLTAAANGALTIDGVAVTQNARVLVAAEATAANNGIYVVTQPGSGSVPYVLTRTPDMTTGSQVPGAIVLAESGTVNGGLTFAVVSAAAFTIGTTAITWIPTPAALSPYGQQQLLTQRNPALTPWYAGLANRLSARCNVVCLGDSITEGQHAAGPPASGFENKWVSRLRDLLRARYPTQGLAGGGRGYINVVGTGESSFTWPAASTGSPSAIGQGPKGAGLQLNTTGQKITYSSLTGDSADIMWTQVFGGGSFSWAVDGGAATNVSTNGGATVDGKITHISLGSPGSHSLVLAWVSGSADIDGIVEYYGDFAQGISVHDAGHFGWQTSSWVTSLNGGVAANSAAAIAALSPNLIVISLGVNDQFSNVNPSTFQSNLQTIISGLKAQLTSPFPAFVIQMYPPRSNQGTYTFAWPLYVAAAYAVAQADTSGPGGSSIVSVMDWTLGPRMPGADTDVYGFWQSGDAVHPSNLGHQALADGLAEFLSWR